MKPRLPSARGRQPRATSIDVTRRVVGRGRRDVHRRDPTEVFFAELMPRRRRTGRRDGVGEAVAQAADGGGPPRPCRDVPLGGNCRWATC